MMRWSKLKQRIEENFTQKLKSRISIHSAAYGNCSCGHAWITLDGEIVANFCTRAYDNRYFLGGETKKTPENQFCEYGEMSRQGVYESCWAFIHELSFDDALNSDNLLIQSLAILDKRLGKRRFTQQNERNLHPLARKLLDVRLSLE